MTGIYVSSHSLLIGGIAGYLCGSIPSAYIVTRAKTGLDLRVHGTGNIGTANALDVTGSRSIAATVLAADVLKGLLPVLVFSVFGLYEPLLVLLPALILGHCYPIWLRFHGGRGLATAAGAMVAVSPVMVVFWGLAFLVAKRVHDHVHFGAIVATGASLALILFLPVQMISNLVLPFSGLQGDAARLAMSIAVMLVIILSRHVEPFLALLRERRQRAE